MADVSSPLQATRQPNHQQFANRRHSRLNAYSIATVVSAFAIAGVLLTAFGASEQQFEIKAIAEKKISELPAGPLYWRVENFPTLAEALAAAGPTALAAEAAGKAWLFTLGPKGESSSHATKVAEIGPVPTFSAPEYLLRVNIAGGPPGAKTPRHTHPGSETFYVLAGELSQSTPHGESRDEAGHSMPGV